MDIQAKFRGKHISDRFMEPEEFRKIIKAAGKDTDMVRAFIIMGFGGLRTIEVTWLKVEDLDKQKKGIWATTAKRRDKIRRFIPLQDWYGIFEDATKGREPGAPLVRIKGEPITKRQIRYFFHKYKAAAGVREALGPHAMRHLAGITRTEAGAQAQEVAAFLGHKTLDMVLVYANLRRERNEEMAASASDILFGKGAKGMRHLSI